MKKCFLFCNRKKIIAGRLSANLCLFQMLGNIVNKDLQKYNLKFFSKKTTNVNLFVCLND